MSADPLFFSDSVDDFFLFTYFHLPLHSFRVACFILRSFFQGQQAHGYEQH